MPPPPAKVRATNARRTSVESTPKYRPMPPHTPPRIRSSRERRRTWPAGSGAGGRSEGSPSPDGRSSITVMLRVRRWGLQRAVLRGLVGPEALVRGGPELADLRHLKVLDGAHQLRPYPPGALQRPEPGVLHSGLVRPEGLQPSHQVGQHGLGEPRSHLTDPQQVAVAVGTDQEGPEGRTPRPSPRGPPQDHAVLRVEGLDLAPVLGPPAREVGAAQLLGDDSFEAQPLHVVEQRPALPVHHQGQPNRSGHGDDLLQESPPFLQRPVREVLAIEPE